MNFAELSAWIELVENWHKRKAFLIIFIAENEKPWWRPNPARSAVKACKAELAAMPDRCPFV